MANRISTVFSFKEEGGGLGKIKSDVKEADGLFGKMKAGVKGVTEELKTNRAAQASLGLAAVAGAKVAIAAASDLEESINAVQVVYGDAADEVLALGETSAESFGLSERAFNQFTTQFSAFATQIADNSGRKVVDVVEEMTTRVADFASVHNLSMEEAGRIAQSTLAGETEAFRRFGGDVSAATIKVYAYENGIADAGAELTEGQKILARYGAFMEQTEATAGDFANTSESLANQQRVMRANIEDSAAAVGKELLPAIAEVAGVVNDAIESFQAFDGAVEGLTGKGTIGTILDIGTKPLKALNDYNSAVVNFGKSLFGSTTQTSKWVDEQVAAIRETVNLEAALEDATAAVEKQSNRVSDLNQWVDKARYLSEQYEKKLDAQERAQEEATEATREAAEAHGEQREKLRALIDTINDAIAGTFDYERATMDMVTASHSYEDQLVATNEVLKDSEASSRDKEAAMIDLREAEIGAAEQAWETAQAFAEEQGASEGSTEAARLQKQELERLAEQFPFLRDEIQLYIDKLNQIPTSRMTQVGVSYSGGGNVRTGGSGSREAPREFDKGGTVPGAIGQPQMILAHGGEFVVPSHKKGNGGTTGGMGGAIELGDDTIRKLIAGFIAGASAGMSAHDAQLTTQLRQGRRG